MSTSAAPRVIPAHTGTQKACHSRAGGNLDNNPTRSTTPGAACPSRPGRHSHENQNPDNNSSSYLSTRTRCHSCTACHSCARRNLNNKTSASFLASSQKTTPRVILKTIITLILCCSIISPLAAMLNNEQSKLLHKPFFSSQTAKKIAAFTIKNFLSSKSAIPSTSKNISTITKSLIAVNPIVTIALVSSCFYWYDIPLHYPTLNPSDNTDHTITTIIHKELADCGVPNAEQVIIKRYQPYCYAAQTTRNNRYIYTSLFIDADADPQWLYKEFKKPTLQSTWETKAIFNHEAGHLLHNHSLCDIKTSWTLAGMSICCNSVLFRKHFINSQGKTNLHHIAQGFDKNFFKMLLVGWAHMGIFHSSRLYHEQQADDYVTQPEKLRNRITGHEETYSWCLKELSKDLKITREQAKKLSDTFPPLLLKYDWSHPPINVRVNREKMRYKTLMAAKKTSRPEGILHDEEQKDI